MAAVSGPAPRLSWPVAAAGPAFRLLPSGKCQPVTTRQRNEKSRAPGSDGRQAQAAGDDRIVRAGGVRMRLSAGRAAFFFASGGRFSRNLLLILSGGRP